MPSTATSFGTAIQTLPLRTPRPNSVATRARQGRMKQMMRMRKKHTSGGKDQHGDNETTRAWQVPSPVLPQHHHEDNDSDRPNSLNQAQLTTRMAIVSDGNSDGKNSDSGGNNSGDGSGSNPTPTASVFTTSAAASTRQCNEMRPKLQCCSLLKNPNESKTTVHLVCALHRCHLDATIANAEAQGCQTVS